MKFFKLFLISALLFMACQMPAQNVYVTKTGVKYHKTNCHYLKDFKKEITLDIAKELAFCACSVCKTGSANTNSNSAENSNSISSNAPPVTQKSTATQCTGKTQADGRCKRMTKSSNGRCYQH